MKIPGTLLISLAVILKSVGLSVQFDCLPNGDPIDVDPRSAPSASAPDRISSGRSLPPVRHHPTAISPSSSGPPLRVRSRTPPAREYFSNILEFRPDELRSVRIMPRNNENRMFELRRYTFPSDKPIRIRKRNYVLNSMPTEEQIVLTTSNGDVFAMLQKLSNKNTCFRGIFLHVTPTGIRAKYNMDSGECKAMTAEEISDCPIGPGNPIRKCFVVSNVEVE